MTEFIHIPCILQNSLKPHYKSNKFKNVLQNEGS